MERILVVRYLIPTIICVFCTFSTSHGSKILVYPFDLQKNAQFYSLVKIAEILADKHEITLLVDRLEPSSLVSKNIRTIIKYSLLNSTDLARNDLELQQADFEGSNVHLLRTERLQAMVDNCEMLFKRGYLMMELDMQKFDLVLADVDNVCARAIIDYLKVPSVIWCYDNYDLYCDFSSDLVAMSTSQGIISRFLHTFKYITYVNIYQPWFIFQAFDKLQIQYSYNNRLSVSDTLSRNKPLVILNSDFSVDMPRPVMPFVIPIAGLVFSNTSDLPHDVDTFIESSGNNGCIYVDCVAQGSWLLQRQIITILDVLARNQRYIILDEGMNLNRDFSGKLKTVPSGFHSAVLNHRKVELVITGCNHRTMHEVIYYGAPVIFLSSFGDSIDYCRSLIERYKIGKVLDVLELGTLELEKEIESMLDNVRFKENMKKLSNVFRHQISNSKERLLHWIEFVSLNQGSEVLYKNAVLNLPWYQYGMLDLIFLVLIGAIFICLISYKVTCFIITWPFRKVFGDRQSKVQNIAKNK